MSALVLAFAPPAPHVRHHAGGEKTVLNITHACVVWAGAAHLIKIIVNEGTCRVYDSDTLDVVRNDWVFEYKAGPSVCVINADLLHGLTLMPGPDSRVVVHFK